jgi:vacuolar-type H+-ATPase subunit F/Vma7
MAKNKEPNQSNINTGGGNYNENIQGNYIQGNYIEGDTTTSAAQRAINAYEEIKSEINSNFVNLSLTIRGVENNYPQKFWDMKRANESELAYQDRARSYFQEYISYINADMRLLQFFDARYHSFKRDLSYQRDIANYVKKTYDCFSELRDYLARLEQGLIHNLSLNLTDSERVNRSIVLHKEHVLNSKASLLRAAAYFCLTLSEIIDGQILSAALEGADIAVSLQPGKEGYKTALSVASELHHQKVIVLQESIAANEKEKTREIERSVTDPTLVMLREKCGLSLDLSEGEIFSLERKTIDENQTNPEELFKLAAHSFFESDGHAAIFYFEKSLESNTLSPRMRTFAQLSLNRLKYPEIYEESIGVIVMKLTPHGNFSTAGLLEGDVIVSLNGQVIYEPMDIASGLATNNPVLVHVIRDNKSLDIVVQGGESAGAALSQLIIARVFQL